MRTLYDHIKYRPANVTGTIVCAMRPLPGDYTWEGDSIGNGIYYAAGDIAEYGKVWEQLDAAIVEYLTDDDIVTMVRTRLEQDGFTPEEIETIDINQACEIYKLPRIA
jgi:hypothetical protein